MSKLFSVKPLNEIEADKSYLVLISPEQIPHLILVHKGRYFSLTYKESILGGDFTTYFDFLKRAGKKMLFIELKNSWQGDLEDAFNAYDSVNTYSVTCLHPVRDFLLPFSEAEFVFELVPELYSANLVENVFHLNLQNQLDELGDFKMNTYSKEAIYSYIQNLKEKNADRKKSISQNA
ncbi:MAG: hypothetical protein MI810_13525 [Flavobacteriales bacterium]|nr:hypothetical protein [Flavobacteriales bacterium]